MLYYAGWVVGLCIDVLWLIVWLSVGVVQTIFQVEGVVNLNLIPTNILVNNLGQEMDT